MVDFLAQGRVEGVRPRTSAAIALVVGLLTVLVAGLSPTTSLAAKSMPPSVSGVSPFGGPPAGGTSVTIRGAHFTGATEVKFGSTSATSFTVKSASVITAASPSGVGPVDVTVTTPEGTSATSPADQFTYGPVVTGVSPNRGPASGRTAVSIAGSDFGDTTAVEFGSTDAASFEVNSPTSITAVSPEGAGTVDVRVTEPEGTSPVSSADQFSYVPAPTVASVSPAKGPETGGTEVTVTGTNLEEATAVDFGLTPASFVVDSADTITAFSPAGTGLADVTVTTAFGGTSLTSFADQFSYVMPPTVTGVSPETGSAHGGDTVTITGTNLAEATAVDFGSTSASSLVVNSEDSITAVAPPGTPGETVDVTVTTIGGTSLTSSADRYRYLQMQPVLVTALSPTEGAFIGGTSVIISGHAFIGATAVDFGSAGAAFTVESQHEIKATAPAGTGTVDVTVTTPEGTSPISPADRFTYTSAGPAVDKIQPTHGRGRGGYAVRILGSNFSGATAVDFGASPSPSFKVVSPSTIRATAPDGAGTVNVTVTTPEGTSPINPDDEFTFKGEPPTIESVEPRTGPATGGTVVGIVGEGLEGATAVHFGGASATSFELDSANSITAVSPAATVGDVEVVVTTPTGNSTLHCRHGHRACYPEDGFKFTDLTVSGVSPSEGSPSGGTAVTITGSGFAPGVGNTQILFGKTPATSVECESVTTCTAVTPPHAARTVYVKARVADSGVRASAKNPAATFTFG